MFIIHHAMKQCSLKEYDKGSRKQSRIKGSVLVLFKPQSFKGFGVRTQLTEAWKTNFII